MVPFVTTSIKSAFLKSWSKFFDAQLNWLRKRSSTTKAAPQKIRGNCYQSTLLDSGLWVASLPAYGQFTTIGVAISAGSRNEVHYPPGTAHFLEKLSFSSSQHFPDKEHTLDLLEKFGALIDCQSTRDTFVYASSCRVENAFDILSIIADAVLRPNILDKEVEYCRDVIRYENGMLSRQPECEPLLNDWIHQAAFRSNTVGLSRYCPSNSVDTINSQHILSFLSQYYSSPRIVLAGVGVDQQWLVEMGKELFNPSETTWNKCPERLLTHLPPVDQSLAQYTGGEVLIEKDLSQMALGPTPFPNLAHIVIGFEGASVSDVDFVPFCVLQSLMGGGGSFSAGGPGKGMYTRLYLDVLNQHHWIYNATAFNHSYTDCGIFCIRASADPTRLNDLVGIILAEFRRLCKGVWAEELERAKVQLKSQLLMNLEMRPVQFEDLARQMLAHGKRKTADEYSELIDKVQNSDIIRISRKMLDSRISIVGYGDIRNMPTYKNIESRL